MSKAPYREASYRSQAHVDFAPPDWWRPHAAHAHLLTATRDTVKRYGAAPFMTWLDDKGKEEKTLSFDGLWERSRVLARKMSDDWGVETGDRVLLCYLPGLAFVEAFWACLRLRCVAVPTYPPDPSKLVLGIKKLDLVKRSCGATLCLTEKALDQMRRALSLTHRWPEGLVWKSTDREFRVQSGENDAPLDNESVAFLQYTSGSTGDPKGVMLTYANVWHNLNEMYLPAQAQHFESRGVDLSRERIVGVSWLPQFHDTGLILCIVGPFVAGYRMVNFSPLTFLKRPLLWLEALTRYGARWSAAPDFAYELCVRRLDGSSSHIDLSRVVQLACGAGERCRPHQLERFKQAFQEKGLRDDVWVPNYGLAEHVVGTCGCARGIVLSSQRPDLACCGEHFQCDLRIVDPISRRDSSRGEIWISSSSVAAGYWGKPDLSLETFHARRILNDGSESRSRYLRTGDEGFLEDGRLYITGRLKDLIIVGGKNYYPEDIEVAAQEADRVVIRPGCVAAFASSTKDEEQVVCVFEVRKGNDVDFRALAETVVRTVGQASGLQPHRILIIPERSIPKTTSGKVQRRQTRKLVDDKKLRVLYDSAGLIKVYSSKGFVDTLSTALKSAFPWALGDHEPAVEESISRNNSAASLTGLVEEAKSPRDDTTEVEAALLRELRKVAMGRVTATTAFHELGLSSRQMVELLSKVEVALDVDLPPTVIFSCPTVRALAHEIVGLRGGPVPSPPQASPQPGFDGAESTVSIVRWSMRLPGACDDLNTLNAILLNSVPCGTTVPLTRWDWRSIDARLHAAGADTEARRRASYGAFCLGSDGWDPKLWGMRPGEAVALDPQQKLLLRQGHELLSSRYATREELRGANVGVMLGMMSADNVHGIDPCQAGPHQLTGNGYASCASRLSFLLDLRGPALVVDTACSGALVAARLGADAVRKHECATCIVGGVSLMLAPGLIHCGAARAGMLSQSGRCHTFDAKADGYLRGEGCALMLLERASSMEWRGSSVKHNGQSATFTALNASSQRDLLRRALVDAGSPAIKSIEAHGTGTRLGDPIELAALSVLDKVTVSGAKACLGHGEPNAGAVGLCATILALCSHAQPNGALRRLNPVVDLGAHLFPPTEAAPVGRGARGVSSFGYSGIIAHAVLRADAPVVPSEGLRRFKDDRPLCHVPSTSVAASPATDAAAALHAALAVSVTLRDVAWLRPLAVVTGPLTVAVDGDLITVSAGEPLLTARRATEEADAFRPAPRAALGEVPDFDRSLRDATGAPADVVGPSILAKAWISARGGVAACRGDHAFAACRQLACLARTREDVGEKRWWEPATCALVVARPGAGPACAAVRTTARHAERGACDARVACGDACVLELRGLECVPIDASVYARPASLQEVRLYRLRCERTASVEGCADVDVLTQLPRVLPANRSGRPRYTTTPSVRTAAPEVALALADARHSWARLSDERGPPFAVACVTTSGARSVVAGAHDAHDRALARAKATRVCAAVLEATDVRGAAPSSFNVHVSSSAPAALRRAAIDATPGAVLDGPPPCSDADVVFVHGAWTRVIARSVTALAQCERLAQHRGADVACVLWRGPATGAAAVVALALRSAEPRTVALATPSLVVPARPTPPPTKVRQITRSTRAVVTLAAKDALGLEEVDATASLADLGMDSLAGAEFVADVSRRLGRAVAPALLLECETLDAVISALGEEDIVEEEAVTIDVEERRLACAPSSQDQELLLWMLRRARARGLKPGYAWLPPTAVGLLEGTLDVRALEWALDRVVDAHDALRSRLVEVPGASKALVVFGVDERPKLVTRVADDVAAATSMAQTFHDASANDLYESTSLLRALLVSTPGNEHVLYLSCNHAVTDGWSHQVLYGELVRAYNARLANDAAPFGHEDRPYAAWLADQATNESAEVLARRRRYARCARLPAWPQLGGPEVLFERGSLLRNCVAKVLPKDMLDGVRRHLSSRLSLPSVVLAAYAHALGRASRGEASVVQYSHPGRTKRDKRTYGQLATDANVLLDGLAVRSVGSFAEGVHRAVLEALSNPTPYAADYVAATHGREAPLPAQYNWYDRYGDVPKWSGVLRATELALDSSTLAAKTFNVGAVYLMALVQGNGSLKLVCYFNDGLYARSTILDALGDVAAFLSRFAEGPGRALPVPSLQEDGGGGRG